MSNEVSLRVLPKLPRVSFRRRRFWFAIPARVQLEEFGIRIEIVSVYKSTLIEIGACSKKLFLLSKILPLFDIRSKQKLRKASYVLFMKLSRNEKRLLSLHLGYLSSNDKVLF